MTGYSSVTPFAPRIVRALRHTSIAPRTFPILPRLTCSDLSVPASFLRPRWSATSSPRFSSSAISASFCSVRAPDDPVARLVQARERTAERGRARQQVLVRHAHVLQDELRRDRGAKR